MTLVVSPNSKRMDTPKETIYEQVNENYRFFAKWRQMAFAGHLAVLAGALSFSSSAVEHGYSQNLFGFCFLLVSGLSIVFWIADRRTHRLTMHACKAGVELEGSSAGFFHVNATLDANEGVRHDDLRRWQMCSHSKAAFLLFLGSSVVFAVAAVIAFAGGFTHKAANARVWDYTLIHGSVTNSATSASSLVEQLARASSNGWEFVSTGTDPSSGAFMILRRQKK